MNLLRFGILLVLFAGIHVGVFADVPADAVYEVVAIQELVKEAYLQELGREPDPYGLLHFSQQLASGEMDKLGLRSALRNSAEYQATKSLSQRRIAFMGALLISAFTPLILLARLLTRIGGLGYIPKLARPLIFCCVAGALFLLTSIPRERLVPFSADYERSLWLLTGDEPAYLITGLALASGHGEDVHSVSRERTYSHFYDQARWDHRYATWDYYTYFSPPRLLDRSHNWGEAQVIHRPPLMALFASPFTLLQQRVRWSVLIAQGIIFSLFGAMITLYRTQEWLGLFWRCWGIVSLWCSLPVYYYTAQVYPEILTGLLLLAGIFTLVSSRLSWRILGYGCLSLALLGTARVGVAVVIVMVYSAWRQLRLRNWQDGVSIGVLLGTYFLYNLWLWGFLTPPNPDETSGLSLLVIPIGLFRNMLSPSVGMFWLTPVSIIASLSVIVTILSKDLILRMSAFMLLGTILVVSAFPNYRAGTCPAGRYQVIQIILMTPAFLKCLQLSGRLGNIIRICSIILGSLSLFISIFVALRPQWWFRSHHPLFAYTPISDLYRWIQLESLSAFVLWITLITAFVAFAWRLADRLNSFQMENVTGIE